MKLATLTGLFVILALSGCSTTSESGSDGPQPVELGAATTVDTPEVELLNEAKNFYEAGLYANAQTSFQKLKDSYPFGKYAEYAEVKMGDCFFYRSDYLTSAMIYSEFVKQHPNSENSPYSMLQLGRSYQLQYSGAGRDMEPLQKSRETLTEMLKKYPNSLYSPEAMKYLKGTDDKIIAHEKLVADYYKNKGHSKAADARMARADILRKEFTNSEENLKTDTTNASAPAVEVPKLFKGTYSPAKTSKAEEKIVQASVRVSQTKCLADNGIINIFLNGRLTKGALAQVEGSVKREGGSLLFKIPGAWANPSTTSCLGENDLSISEDGKFVITTDRSPSFFVVENPHRLIVSLE
jgi:outer membrane protein assembly factor BamD